MAAASTPTFDDLDLATRARDGDSSAFSRLVDAYASKIYRLARHMLRNDQDAEDVLQDTFLKAYSRIDQFQGNSKFYTWLVRIAVNEALMRKRRKDSKNLSLDADQDGERQPASASVQSDGETPEQSYGRTELRGILGRAIDTLSDTYRSVFLLRDVEGLSTQETAEALELSESAVKSRLLRARLQLRNKLGRRLDRVDRRPTQD